MGLSVWGQTGSNPTPEKCRDFRITPHGLPRKRDSTIMRLGTVAPPENAIAQIPEARWGIVLRGERERSDAVRLPQAAVQNVPVADGYNHGHNPRRTRTQ